MRFRRFAALAGAAALTAAGTFIPAGPANAASNTGDVIFLANDFPFGMYAASGVVHDSTIAVDRTPGYWVLVAPPGGLSGQWEIAAVTASGKVTDWCIASTAVLATPALQPCGANGTVFVAVESGDGYLLYDRFLLDEGKDDVLAVNSPANGRPVVTLPVNDVGGSWFGRWVDSQDSL